MRIGRPQRSDQARPFVALALAFAVWLVLPVAVKSVARVSFFEMTAPIRVAASYVGDLQRFWALRLHSKDELIEAGRDMARINAQYSVSMQQNGELQAEVERLHSYDVPEFIALPIAAGSAGYLAWIEESLAE